MKKSIDEFREPPVFLSLIDTGTSTIRMLFKIWGAVRHENHASASVVPSDDPRGDRSKGLAA
jgi:hypothetical protein